jgi:16S rRNA (cytosine1402-N4)-methyltransferase
MYHNPVLLNESVESLEIKNGGIYVDLTFGGGGHSKEILKKIDKSGKLIAFDQDIDAHKNAIKDPRFHLLHQNFIYLKQNLEYLGINKVDGVLADLGVSSFQFDTNERGFTYANDSRLDMRMDVSSELDAVSLLNDYDESELSRIFFDFSDLRNSRKIAQLICVNRKNKKIQRSDELNKILKPLYNDSYKNKFLARVYQAIRIEVNNEINALKKMLNQVVEVLSKNGIVSIITYHSIEDRLVKRFFKNSCFDNEPKKDHYGNKILSLKPKYNFITPSKSELKLNNRSRSAKLRSAIKI